MNLLERAIAAAAPRYAVKRASARTVLAAYEAARPTPRHKKSRDNSSGERQVVRDAAACRAIARDLERNHDLVRGALQTLTRNIVGPSGISIEPTPRKGTPGSDDYDDIDDDFARDLLNGWREWCKRPEVTRTLNWAQVQELACRSWLRDGDQFTQLVEGTGAFIRHGSAVPLSLELLEADVVPLDYADEATNTDGGITRNAWGEPTSFFVYKRHPGNGGWFSNSELKQVPAERMLHLAVRERLSGLRGISILSSAINRLLDLKDYEESERIAARIAAAIAAYVKRDVNMEGWTPPPLGPDGKPPARDFFLEAGAVFSDTAPGESIEMLDPKRPNTALESFRTGQLRAAARAMSLTYSAMSGDYDGTYSAQRQELVEGYDGYRVLTGTFVSNFVQPIWERYVALAIASGQLKVPAGVRRETVAQADFRGPKMPWIDPKKEAEAVVTMTRGGIQSLSQAIAERGGRMQDVFEQLARERRLADELGLVLDSDARVDSAAPAPPEEADDTAPPARTGTADPADARARAPRLRAIHTGAESA